MVKNKSVPFSFWYGFASLCLRVLPWFTSCSVSLNGCPLELGKITLLGDALYKAAATISFDFVIFLKRLAG